VAARPAAETERRRPAVRDSSSRSALSVDESVLVSPPSDKETAGLQLVVGFHAVVARLRQAPQAIKTLYVDADRRDKRMTTLQAQARMAGVAVHAVPSLRLDGLSQGVRHQGVVALAEPLSLAVDVDELLDEVIARGQQPLLLILDGVTDPHNLGACLRTADAAGVHAVIAPRDRAAGLNATVRRVSCGAADTVPYIMVTNLARTLRSLRDRDIWVVGTDGSAEAGALHDVDAARPMAWVMGAEGDGMRRLVRENCDALVAIPMLGSVESLNVSVAAGICLYETVRQRR